jgi:hypothetical protein
MNLPEGHLFRLKRVQILSKFNLTVLGADRLIINII